MDHVPHDQLDAALAVLDTVLEPQTTLGVLLYGSAVVGGLRADSDLDLFVVTERRTTADEKRELIRRLLQISGRETRLESWRPLDVTIVVQSDVRPWRYPPRWDLQYGEWLRLQFLDGDTEPWPATNPDLAIQIAMVLSSGVPLRGPAPSELLDPIPNEDLVRAMVDEVPQLLGDLEGDTRNVLLTLARIWSTVATHEIRSKDVAADWALTHLPPHHQPVLARARTLYRDGGFGRWDDMDMVRAHVEFVVAEIIRESTKDLAMPERRT